MLCRLIFPLILTVLLVLPAEWALADCMLTNIGQARVVSIPDGRSLVLEDGRDVLLAGIEPVPGHPEAAAMLRQRALGRVVTLRAIPARPGHKADRQDFHDRHGRLSAFVFVEGAALSLQEELLRAGLVRAAGPVGSSACWTALLQQEQKARAQHQGLWSVSAQGQATSGLHHADQPAAIRKNLGHFILVEGKILSVRESGGTIYLNFGKRWSEDFTATIPKRLEHRFTAAGIDLQKLAGRTIRIRGFVEERGGPWIEVVRPDQVEMTDPLAF